MESGLAVEEYFDWSMETWELGAQNFWVQAAQGQNIHITRIVGCLTAGCLPHADIASTNTRQTLLSVTYGGSTIPAKANVVYTAPGGRNCHSTAGHYVIVNAKQMGNQVVAIPFERTFDPPLPCAAGLMQAWINNVTSDGNQNVTDPHECIDAEVHMTVFFTRD